MKGVWGAGLLLKLTLRFSWSGFRAKHGLGKAALDFCLPFPEGGRAGTAPLQQSHCHGRFMEQQEPSGKRSEGSQPSSPDLFTLTWQVKTSIEGC